MEKRPLIIDSEEEIEVYKFSNKRQRLIVLTFAIKKILNKQRITNISKDVKSKDVISITKTATKPSTTLRPLVFIRLRLNFL